MRRIFQTIVRYNVLFWIGGVTYYLIEKLWRGYSDESMIITAGLIMIYTGLLNEGEKWDTPFQVQLYKSWIFTLVLEFLTGCVVNILICPEISQDKLRGNLHCSFYLFVHLQLFWMIWSDGLYLAKKDQHIGFDEKEKTNE